ncbi:MAG: hypothetical protein ABIY70_09100 [Capsulimonas sp.]|uniref:hypothetical protein n=1 Tax=Capsulimonas sp. TaxID=2494211 RepID=UPI00326315D7
MPAYTPTRITASAYVYSTPATYLNDGSTTTRAEIVENQSSGTTHTGAFDLFMLDLGAPIVLSSIVLTSLLSLVSASGNHVLNIYANNDGTNPRAGGTVNLIGSQTGATGAGAPGGTLPLSGTYQYVFVEYTLDNVTPSGDFVVRIGTITVNGTIAAAPINPAISQVY